MNTKNNPLEKLLQEARRHVFPNSAGSDAINAAEAELVTLRQLHAAATALCEIVEGVPSERWAHNGFRFKDTKQWCAFYVALGAVERGET